MFIEYTSIALLLKVAASSWQCEDTLPDGSVCAPEDHVTVADPESCFKYYKCAEGCVTRETCPNDEKYDDRYHWCTYPYDVDCGDRPCSDPVHCPPPTTTAATTQDCSPPDHKINCTAVGNGYFPDEFNCRKYWNCIPGSEPRHFICPDDEHGNPEMFDTVYMGCNYAEQTQCDGRPICDECDNNCQDTPTPKPDCTPPEQKISCKDLGAGYHPDMFNCRKYWHCLKEDAEPVHLTCDTDEQGEFMMWDLMFDGCNFGAQTDCGERQVCDDCNEECWPHGGGGDDSLDCNHDMDCSVKPDGWYADPYSCVKYWNCFAGRATHYMCDEGTFYDPGHNWCDFPENVNCGNRPPCNECEEGCP